MLRQILETGYVDPELLEQLTVDQKEILFCKIREEQVRKWRLREEDLIKKERIRPPKRTARKISFLEGKDGLPLAIVIGEEEKLLRYKEEEELKREAQRIRREAEELAKQETRRAVKIEESDDVQGLAIPHSESVFENLQESPELQLKGQAKQRWRKAVQSTAFLIKQMSEKERIEYQRRRAEEIFMNLFHANQLAKQRAAEMAKTVEERWKRSETEAKAFERNRKQSFTRARQLVARGVDVDKNVLGSIPADKQAEIRRKIQERAQAKSLKPSTFSSQGGSSPFIRKHVIKPKTKRSSRVMPDTEPKSMDHAVTWFKEYEAPRGVGRERDGSVSLWFHGVIDRSTADRLLEDKTVGAFLVRLSKRIWGYTVSVRADQFVKHYVIDASAGEYTFLGPGQPSFKTLEQLLSHYKVNPITWVGQELLLVPCAQASLHSTQQLYASEEDEEEVEVSAL